MKCQKCGADNKEGSKFCTSCGMALNDEVDKNKSNNATFIIGALVVVIIILIACFGYFTISDTFQSNSVDDNNVQSANTTQSVQESSPKTTTSSSSVPVSESKSWVLIGSYSGSGSGSQVITVPEGQIMIKLTAFPIKNYATNHLYVSGSNGESAGVDWSSTSAVASKSNSLSYTSSSSQTFTIDYYETVSWNVDFYRYQ